MRAIIDVDELKQFDSALKRICGNLRDEKNSMNQKFLSLKEVWKDKNYHQFEKTFTTTITEIDQFLRYAEMYNDYLRQKARAAERYLEGGY